MDKSHIGELDNEKVKRRGLLRDHWLLYAGGWYVFKNYPFFSYVFFLKTWGFTVWFASVWMLFGRAATKIWRRNEQMQLQKTAEGVMDGEDSIVANMRKFANDSSSVDYLKNFKEESQATLAAYRSALVNSQKQQVTDRVAAQLQAIARMELSFAGNLQDLLVMETSNSFRSQFSKDKKMQEDAFSSALESVAGSTASAKADPVLKHFAEAMKSIEKSGASKIKPNKEGSIAERVAFAQQESEDAFKKAFYVSQAEAEEVRKIAAKAKTGSGFDWSKLDETAAKRLDELYISINNKVGFVMPSERNVTAMGDFGSEQGTKSYVDATNAQLVAMTDKLRSERLSAFAAAF